jgi:hypothetical protein
MLALGPDSGRTPGGGTTPPGVLPYNDHGG